MDLKMTPKPKRPLDQKWVDELRARRDALAQISSKFNSPESLRDFEEAQRAFAAADAAWRLVRNKL